MSRIRFRPLVLLTVLAFVLSACGEVKGEEGGPDSGPIKIGYVSPETGALASFGESDNFVVEQVREHFKSVGGITVAGKQRPVEILVRDTQSDSKRAADVAADLILNEHVDLILTGHTPDTANPVADQGEANGVPVISTLAPWQPYFFGRKGNPDKPFKWTYHFFFGLEDLETVYTDMWNEIDTNKKVGELFPNDPDGKAFSDAKTGFPAVAAKNNYKVVDAGRYANGTQDFSAQISTFKEQGVDILAGVPIPPDFTTFWKQAAQQGFRPKFVTIGKALLTPSNINALGDLGNNLGMEIWWSPSHPYSSSLTGQTAQQLADAYTAKTGRQWTQFVGFVHALFEVAATTLSRSDGTKEGFIKTLSHLKTDTVVGPLDWTSGPVPNVAKTPLVGGQWRQNVDKSYSLVVVSNKQNPEIPLGGKVEPLR
ncbi:MAG TPA: ABC transporter substrate-binding protein [Actinophytocola sp.]|uniref:ABC transporter substrate-binding protein n=1 Tax=Actinophytocola sp. TaxID=1872138 RepID=UPI002F94B6D1